jgi:hypothetical protein
MKSLTLSPTPTPDILLQGSGLEPSSVIYLPVGISSSVLLPQLSLSGFPVYCLVGRAPPHTQEQQALFKVTLPMTDQRRS